MAPISQTLRDLAQRFGWKLLKLLISFALLTWLVLRFDWGEVIGAIANIPLWYLPITFVVYLSAQLFGARRLQVLLNAQLIPITFIYSVRLTLLALFSGNFLPTTVGGDAVKGISLTRQGYRLDHVAASLVVDRLINVVAVVFFLPTTFFWTLPQEAAFSVGLPNLSFLHLLGIGAVLISFFYGCYRLLLWSEKTAKFLKILQGKIWNACQTLRTIMSRWWKQPLVIFHSFVLSWFSILSGFLTAWFISKGLGMTISMLNIIAIEVVIYFVSLLPISINGLGVQEVGRLQMLSGFGATSSQGLALAVLMRLFYFAISLLGVFELVLSNQAQKE